jgi:hypothetical protein
MFDQWFAFTDDYHKPINGPKALKWLILRSTTWWRSYIHRNSWNCVFYKNIIFILNKWPHKNESPMKAFTLKISLKPLQTAGAHTTFYELEGVIFVKYVRGDPLQQYCTNDCRWRFHAQNTKWNQSISDDYPKPLNGPKPLQNAYFTFYDEFEGPVHVQAHRL